MPIMPRVPYPQHILEAMEKDKPSREPSYWAKKGCRDCLGRGVIGKTTKVVGNGNKIINEQLCPCVRKAFAVWQDKWMEEHKDKAEEQPKEVAVSALDPDMKRTSPVEERIDRIETMCGPIKDEIEKLLVKRGQLGQDHNLEGYEREIEEARQELECATHEAQHMLKQSAELEEEAVALYEKGKVKRQEAEHARTTLYAEKHRAMQECMAELQRREEAAQNVQAVCKREAHRLTKKINELNDKLDRLEERRIKVLREHGLDPVITQEIVAPS